MTCDEMTPLLAAREELSFGQEQQVQAHLRSCATCRRQWETIRRAKRVLRQLPPATQEPPAAVAMAIRARLRRRPIFSARPSRAIPAILTASMLLLVVFGWASQQALSVSTALPGASMIGQTAAPPAAEPDSAVASLQPDAAPAALTVLILGSDAQSGRGAPASTDSVTLVQIDQASGRVAALALPRSLWMTYPDGTQGRLGEAFRRGEETLGAGSGMVFARQTVRTMLGVPIDYVAVVEFAGFVRVIDRIGGITIDVPAALSDPRYPTADGGITTVEFAAGPQHLDGARALQYVRTRHADGELARDQRQLQVLNALLAQVRGSNLLAQLDTLDAVREALRDGVATDLPPERQLDLARWAAAQPQLTLAPLALTETDLVPLATPATFTLTAAGRDAIRAHLAVPHAPAGGALAR